MKKIIVTALILAACMLIIPLLFVKKSKNAASERVKTAAVSAAAVQSEKQISFRIKTKDRIITLSADDYITGVVAAEMPASYETEALKSQSVAAFSFALYKKERAKDADYDLTDSYKTDQSYLSEAALKEKWGDAYDQNIEKIKNAVLSVSGEYLSYGGKPALALYHSLSPGKTNSCADVFGSRLPYLVSVNSKSDALSPDYRHEISFGQTELNRKLNLKTTDKEENSFSDIKTGENGVIKQITFAGKSFSGAKLAGLLGLPSPNFTVKYSSGKYTFVSFGHGHGVGLSQYGAGEMAKAGSDYREILAHYYPGTKIEKF